MENVLYITVFIGGVCLILIMALWVRMGNNRRMAKDVLACLSMDERKDAETVFLLLCERFRESNPNFSKEYGRFDVENLLDWLESQKLVASAVTDRNGRKVKIYRKLVPRVKTEDLYPTR